MTLRKNKKGTDGFKENYNNIVYYTINNTRRFLVNVVGVFYKYII